MGKVSIIPKNWETGGKSLLKKQWVIRYRYYDDNKGISKQIWISDFNRVNDQSALPQEWVNVVVCLQFILYWQKL